MKKVVFLTALLVLCAAVAMAQKPSATMTIHEQGLPSGQGHSAAALPSGGCPNGDCLFYGGDGDPNSPNADGLWNNNSSYFGIQGQVFSPFVWAKASKCGGACNWAVDGLVVYDEMYPYPPLIDSADWSILTNVVAGGTPATSTTVCSGTGASATATDSGRLYFGLYEEYAVAVPVSGCTIGKVKKSKNPEYWMNVTVNTSQYQLAYQSNSPSNANAIGTAEPVDQSYFLSAGFGFPSFTNTTQLGPFDTFSAAVCGALSK